jgi:hypothetical protein
MSSLPRGSASLVDSGSSTWRRALDAVPHDVYHLPEYAIVDLQDSASSALAFVYQDGNHTLLLPLVLVDVPGTGLRHARSSYGYPGPVSDAGTGPAESERF